MSAEQENLSVIDACWLAYNDERIADAAILYADDARLRHLTRDIDVSGREPIRELMTRTLAMFPDRRSDRIASIASGDFVVTENHWEATSTESGDRLKLDMCYVFRLVDGKIAEQREYG